MKLIKVCNSSIEMSFFDVQIAESFTWRVMSFLPLLLSLSIFLPSSLYPIFSLFSFFMFPSIIFQSSPATSSSLCTLFLLPSHFPSPLSLIPVLSRSDPSLVTVSFIRLSEGHQLHSHSKENTKTSEMTCRI